jgi:hypothetical protein
MKIKPIASKLTKCGEKEKGPEGNDTQGGVNEAKPGAMAQQAEAARDAAVQNEAFRIWKPTLAVLVTLSGLAAWLMNGISTPDTPEAIVSIYAGSLQLVFSTFLCVVFGAGGIALFAYAAENRRHIDRDLPKCILGIFMWLVSVLLATVSSVFVGAGMIAAGVGSVNLWLALNRLIH